MPALSEQFEQWAQMPIGSTAGWEYAPLEVGGQVAAIAAIQGTEIHFAADPQWRGRVITRGRCRAFLGPLMARFGYLTTRTADNGKSADFLRRMGFDLTWSSGTIDHYMLTAMPFYKGH